MNKDHERPSLSIVVNNYNYADFIAPALDSALSQMDVIDELLVVDDGSTDNSLEVLQKYFDAGAIRLIQQPNQGQMKAVRAGIEAAEKDVILLLDSDDYFLTGHLDRLRHIYRTEDDVSFVFSKATVFGEASGNEEQMRRSLKNMELPSGRVGPTKWATLMFYEFVGTPTSGLSFRRDFVRHILAMPEEVDQTVSLGPATRRILGISLHEAQKNGFYADGVIVRCASALGEIKYYNEESGFAYRIHGSNKFATVPLRGRLYLRMLRKREFIRLLINNFALDETPASVELITEMRNRSWPKCTSRRLRLRLEYCLATFKTKGTLRQKLTALVVASGLIA